MLCHLFQFCIPFSVSILAFSRIVISTCHHFHVLGFSVNRFKATEASQNLITPALLWAEMWLLLRSHVSFDWLTRVDDRKLSSHTTCIPMLEAEATTRSHVTMMVFVTMRSWPLSLLPVSTFSKFVLFKAVFLLEYGNTQTHNLYKSVRLYCKAYFRMLTKLLYANLHFLLFIQWRLTVVQ